MYAKRHQHEIDREVDQRLSHGDLLAGLHEPQMVARTAQSPIT